MTTLDALTHGDRVTVTYQDGDTVRTWHGKFTGIVHVMTGHRPEMPSPLDYRHSSFRQAMEPFGTRPWARISPLGHYIFDPQGLAETGPCWSLNAAEDTLLIDPAAEGVTIEPLTPGGEQSLHLYEHPFMIRKYVVAKVAQQNEVLAALIDQVIDDLVAEGREDAEEMTRREYGDYRDGVH